MAMAMAAYVASPERSGNAATQHKVAQRSSHVALPAWSAPITDAHHSHAIVSAHTVCGDVMRANWTVRSVRVREDECTRVHHVRAAAARSIHRYSLLDRGSLGCSGYCRY